MWLNAIGCTNWPRRNLGMRPLFQARSLAPVGIGMEFYFLFPPLYSSFLLSMLVCCRSPTFPPPPPPLLRLFYRYGDFRGRFLSFAQIEVPLSKGTTLGYITCRFWFCTIHGYCWNVQKILFHYQVIELYCCSAIWYMIMFAWIGSHIWFAFEMNTIPSCFWIRWRMWYKRENKRERGERKGFSL